MLSKIKVILSQSFFYGLGNFIAKAGGFVLLLLYALYINKSEIGLLAMYETAFMFMLVICGWGSKSGFARWYNDMKSEQQKKSLFFTTYFFNVFTGILGMVLTAVVLFNLNLFNGADSGRIIVFFSASSLLRLLFDVPFVLLRLRQKAFKQTIYQSINVGLTVLFSIYFLEIRQLGFEGIFLAQLLANGCTLLSVLPLIIKSCHWSFQQKVLGEMINYGYPLAISNILTLVLTVSDRYILEAYYSLEAVGSFSIAIKVANLLQFLVVASFVTSYTFQYYKSMNESDNSRYHVKIFTYFVLFMVLAGLGIVFFGKEIIYVVMAGKTEYFDAIPVIPWLVLGLIFSGMRQVFVLPITKAKQTRLISMVMVLSGILNVGLNFLVIPIFGKEGAAFTTAASQLFAAVWFLIKIRQIDNTNYEWRKIGLVLFFGAILCLSGFYIPSFNWAVDVAIKLALLIGFVFCLFWFRFFEEIELLRIKQAWAKWRNPFMIKNNIKNKNM